MSISPQDRSAVLVDRHPMWMDAMAEVIGRAHVSAAAKVTSATMALARIADLRPDLLVTELQLAADDIDSFAFVSQAREQVEGLRVIVLSGCETRKCIDAAFAAGADAFVLKTADADDLVSAIHQVFKHSVFLAAGQAYDESPALPRGQNEYRLTRREVDILRLAAEGHSNAQLAQMLWVTEQTVKFHLSNIYRKLGVSNRTEASRWAQLKGLLPSSTVSSASG
jgi:NarL family two-component system response regulator LiaR